MHPALIPATFVLLWSTGFIGAKLGLPYAEPLTFLSIRFILVVALMLPLALAFRAPWPKSRREFWHVAVAGVLVHGGYLGGVFSAIHAGVSAGMVALIAGLQPVLTATLAARFLGESVSPRQWLGFLLGLTGVALVTADRHAFAGSTGTGLALATLALFSMTVGTLYQKRHCGGMDLRSGAVIQFGAALAVLGPLALLLEGKPIVWSGPFVFALLWLVLVLSMGAISLLWVLVRRGEASRVSSLFYLTPPTTAVIAFLVFGERLGLPALAGMGLAAAGVALVTRR